ncbi:hypothetical protein D9M69_734430 [compost metagenome]
MRVRLVASVPGGDGSQQLALHGGQIGQVHRRQFLQATDHLLPGRSWCVGEQELGCVEIVEGAEQFLGAFE